MDSKMKEVCIFDKSGTLINIGEWNYNIEQRESETVVNNPMPEGAYAEEREVVVNADGSRSLVN